MQTVTYERQGDVGRIVLANPPYNRVDGDLAKGLRDAVQEAGRSDIRVLLITATGPNFSFGGGTKEVVTLTTNQFRTRVTAFNDIFRAIEGLRVPTVAAVRGMCMGGGFELTLSCDFLLASESARFQCVEVTTGMVPIAGAIQRLCEKAGRGWASRISMLGEHITGAHAAELGIASHLTDDDKLEAETEALVQRLAVGPTKSYAATRTLLKAWSGGGVPLADSLMLDIAMELYETEDCKRGFAGTVDAYAQGQIPEAIVFQGR